MEGKTCLTNSGAWMTSASCLCSAVLSWTEDTSHICLSLAAGSSTAGLFTLTQGHTCQWACSVNPCLVKWSCTWDVTRGPCTPAFVPLEARASLLFVFIFCFSIHSRLTWFSPPLSKVLLETDREFLQTWKKALMSCGSNPVWIIWSGIIYSSHSFVLKPRSDSTLCLQF